MLLRAATSTVSGLVRNSPARRRISSEKVAEKSSVWRLAGMLADDLADVGDEAHVEHPVGLVQDEDLDLGEVDAALADVVEQAAGCGDQDLDAAPEGLDLGIDAGAAVDDGRPERNAPTVCLDRLGDLDRQLAGRGEDEDPHRVARRREAGVAVVPQGLQDRQDEGGGLAGSGLGGGETSRPARIRGMAALCTGVGSV